MSGFVIKNGVLKKHSGNCRDVVIPNGVTSIGHHAFNCCISLKSIIIPESVTSIEYNAFFMCQNLKSIVIGNNVTSIENEAFSYCTSLTSITIPDNVTSIGEYAFDNCKNLTDLFVRGYQIHGNFGSIKNFTQKLNDAILMLDNKDFSVKLEKELKFPFVLAYYRKTKDETAFTYIKKNFLKIVTYLIDQNDIATVTAIVNSGKFLTKRNIDKMIDHAIDKERHEIQVILMDYKNGINGYTDVETDFSKRFDL